MSIASIVALLPWQLGHLEAHVFLGWKLDGNHVVYMRGTLGCSGCWYVSLVQISIPLSLILILRIGFSNLGVFSSILCFSRLAAFAFFVAAECNSSATAQKYNNGNNAWSFKWWSGFYFTLSGWTTHSLVSLADHVRVIYDKNWSSRISFQSLFFRHCLNFWIILLFGHLGSILELGLRNLDAVIIDEIVFDSIN